VVWFAFVLPALLVTYFGQGALVLSDPQAAQNPFFLMFPGWMLIPVVALATAATVIASQAVIAAAYTLSQQATLLSLLPRLEIRQTSQSEIGQVYIPQINWILALAVVGLVLGFRSSDALASAYGIAVATAMLATTTLAGVVARRHWDWSLPLTLAVVGTVTHIFLLWAKDLISLADLAASGGRARDRTCSMKRVIGPRPSSGRLTLGMPDAPTVS
jgi:KUP system potassium uptake protein